jgi:hypothetical protein
MGKNASLALCAALALAGCGSPKVELIFPLAIIDVAPTDGATGVDPATQPTVCWSRPMDPALAARSLLLQQENGDAVGGQSLSAGSDSHCLLIQHDRLQGNAFYFIRALKGLSSSDGQSLAAEVSSRFRTAP